MNRLLGLAVVIFFSAFQAQAAEATKIAIVDIQKIVSESTATKD